jgi:hypothetical protein
MYVNGPVIFNSPAANAIPNLERRACVHVCVILKRTARGESVYDNPVYSWDQPTSIFTDYADYQVSRRK